MAQEQRPEKQQETSDQSQELSQQAQEQQPVMPEAVNESVRAAVQRMWEVVQKGADIIVTLRQENEMLQSQVSTLRKSETQLQDQLEDFLQRIDQLEKRTDAALTSPAPGDNTDRLEDRVGELEELLNGATAQLEETSAQLRAREEELEKVNEQLDEQSDITQQLNQVRNELEARTQLLQELQDAFENREITVEHDEERDRLQAELDRSIKIIEKYRSAGLRHLESEDTEDQITLFTEAASSGSPLSNEELKALADRLEGVAKRLDDLFGLS